MVVPDILRRDSFSKSFCARSFNALALSEVVGSNDETIEAIVEADMSRSGLTAEKF